MSKLLQPENRKALCNIVRRIAIEAGDLTLRYFDESGSQEREIKGDGSPVTIADKIAQDYINTKLAELTPTILIVGEESAKPDVRQAEYFWLVDPLDGTKEFISGSGDYTVNIALIHNHQPVMGVVYAPYFAELYAAHGEGTAMRWTEEGGQDKSISVREPSHKGLTVVSSKSHGKGEKLEKFLENYKVAKAIQRGSSLKICSVAAGKADMYPRFGLTCEWDTAAAHAVLNAAGGVLTDIEGKELQYGLCINDKFLNPEFIARSSYIALPHECEEA